MKKNNSMRPFTVQRHFIKHNPGSVLISFGDTKVICSATIENSVPRFLRDSGKGWLTSEYSLLPSSTFPRAQREAQRGKVTGRTTEIQRLIGRSLRAVIDFDLLGERTIYIDADVIQADGGTRTASITGGMIALWDCVQHLIKSGDLKKNPITEFLSAVSVGLVNGDVICDLCYEEDSNADVDMNIVMTESGRFVEIQGTAEKDPFSEEQFAEMLASAKGAISSTIQTIKSDILSIEN